MFEDIPCSEIHSASVNILENTGIEIRHEEVCEMLEEEGCEVEDSLVKIPERIIEDCISKAPSSVTLYSKDRKHDLVLDGKKPFFGTVGGPSKVYDLDSGGKREAKVEDNKNFACISDELENIDYYHIMCNPTDVEPQLADKYKWMVSFENTSKHILGGVEEKNTMDSVIEMASTIVGGREELRERPIMSVIIGVTSPLTLPKTGIDTLKTCVDSGVPVIPSVMALGGATSPATLASTLAQTNAEALSMVVLTQLIEAGSPVLVGSVSTIMDMKHARASVGGPELALLSGSETKMARYYELPIYGTGGCTDSKVPNYQAGVEKALSALSGAFVNTDLIHGMAGHLDGFDLASYEQLVLDDELIGMIKKIYEGIDFEDKFALDIIDRVGPGGNFLREEHTRENYEQEFLSVNLFEKREWKKWKKDDKTLIDKARERCKDILSEQETPKLNEDLSKKLRDLI